MATASNVSNAGMRSNPLDLITSALPFDRRGGTSGQGQVISVRGTGLGHAAANAKSDTLMAIHAASVTTTTYTRGITTSLQRHKSPATNCITAADLPASLSLLAASCPTLNQVGVSEWETKYALQQKQNKKFAEEKEQLFQANKKMAEENEELLRANKRIAEEKEKLFQANKKMAKENGELLQVNKKTAEEKDQANMKMAQEKEDLLQANNKIAEEKNQLFQKMAEEKHKVVQEKNKIEEQKEETERSFLAMERRFISIRCDIHRLLNHTIIGFSCQEEEVEQAVKDLIEDNCA